MAVHRLLHSMQPVFSCISSFLFLFTFGMSMLFYAAPLYGAESTPLPSSRNLQEIVYRETRENFPNPERGFYAPRMSRRLDKLEGLREQGITLLLVEMDLREFKERDLSPEKLTELREALAAARQNGLKIIFRAAYGFTRNDYRADPTDMNRILGHVRQLGAVLTENAGILFSVQAGFLGPWGEWHGSNWGDPPSLEARRSVLFGWLDALPESIMVEVRRPMFIRDIYTNEPGGSTLTVDTAYRGSKLSRTGWHDDSFLSLPDDGGTFVEPGWDRQRELLWCGQHSRFTSFGGESVGNAANTPIDQVIREMELYHPVYLNIAYHPAVLRGWRQVEYRGETAFDYIARRLGYRFVAERLCYTKAVKPGETCHFELMLRNAGFASPHSPRTVMAGLWRSGESRLAQPVILQDADPRRWEPEAGTIRLSGEIPIPKDLPLGTWQLALQLADPSPSLRDDGRYAIHLANEDISFSELSGLNILADDILVQ
ncbi:MAG: DUF4832 domain-containing protein [bacterium]